MSGRLKVKTLKAQFKTTFGATLRVYKNASCKGPLADDDATLASIRAEGYKGGDFAVKGNMLVGNFEKRVANLFGIGVQVASPDDEHLVDNSLTLSASGKDMSESETKDESKFINVFVHFQMRRAGIVDVDSLLDSYGYDSLDQLIGEEGEGFVMSECDYKCYLTSVDSVYVVETASRPEYFGRNLELEGGREYDDGYDCDNSEEFELPETGVAFIQDNEGLINVYSLEMDAAEEFDIQNLCVNSVDTILYKGMEYQSECALGDDDGEICFYEDGEAYTPGVVDLSEAENIPGGVGELLAKIKAQLDDLDMDEFVLYAADYCGDLDYDEVQEKVEDTAVSLGWYFKCEDSYGGEARTVLAPRKISVIDGGLAFDVDEYTETEDGISEDGTYEHQTIEDILESCSEEQVTMCLENIIKYAFESPEIYDVIGLNGGLDI